MAKILTNTQSAHEHYLTMQYDETDFPRLGTLSITGATTLTTALESSPPTAGANHYLVACVSSITALSTATTITMGAAGSVTIPKYAPLDSIWRFDNAGSFDITIPGSPTFTVTGGTAGTLIEVFVIDMTAANWLDLGQNFNEGVSFTRGLTAAPVARGWSATDHQKRIRSMNNWTIRQMYCSNLEGVANLRGRIIRVKDEVHTDGSAVIKEIFFNVKVQVQNATSEFGGGGGDTMVDVVNAVGYFGRQYCLTLDATSLTATA